ncbi:MAG: phosphate/phosphite/phosphonate ABC transporter substrate-binding protein [Duodenibacillus sp.]
MKKAWLVFVWMCVFSAQAALPPASADSALQCEPPAVVNRSPESVIRVGYTPFGLMADEKLMLKSLKSTLTREKLGHPVVFREYSPRELRAAIEDGSVDIVFSESPFYQAMIASGLRSVTTIVCDVQPDPNQNDGTAVIVRSDSAYREIADLRGTRLAAASPDSFSGYLYAVREIVRRGLGNADTFFASRDFIARRAQEDGNATVFDAVVSGRADVGFLPLCALEQLAKTDPAVHSKIRVVEERFTDAVTDCRHSTPLYPALTLSVTPRISASMSKAVTMDLLMLPKGDADLCGRSRATFKTPTNY